MKKTMLCALVSCAFFFQACGQGQPKNQVSINESKEYANISYRFSVETPNDWKLYRKIINDTVNQKSTVDWGLPVVYSELEKTTIENSISITAYRRKDINSVSQLILAEYLRVDPTKHALEIDSTSENARLIYSTVNKNKYKGKSYFVFNNGIGYVVNFMATPGTYDKNIAKFEAFYKRIKFL
ncbi:hypothetical protein [Fibrivirga algicola]|uniref:PsbP C-terminal domain-containing protein n=1 Tax=Fibrivirga algicola TaxID=2950420 RepID=A0ABX0QB52_9BACT|nr:hypothetical protein [Fibrivirga algicola]NID09535.1 hypothetical protein [Fibrivirga algicola]